MVKETSKTTAPALPQHMLNTRVFKPHLVEIEGVGDTIVETRNATLAQCLAFALDDITRRQNTGTCKGIAQNPVGAFELTFHDEKTAIIQGRLKPKAAIMELPCTKGPPLAIARSGANITGWGEGDGAIKLNSKAVHHLMGSRSGADRWAGLFTA